MSNLTTLVYELISAYPVNVCVPRYPVIVVTNIHTYNILINRARDAHCILGKLTSIVIAAGLFIGIRAWRCEHAIRGVTAV